jgi:hypothetical protein
MDRAALDARFRVVSLVWASLLAGVSVFAGLAWALGSGRLGPAFPAAIAPGVASKLLILAPLMMAMGIAYRNGDLGAHAEPEHRLAAYQNRVLVALALEEAGALLGLTLCLLSARPAWTLAVWGMAAVAMFLSRPHRDELDRIAK